MTDHVQIPSGSQESVIHKGKNYSVMSGTIGSIQGRDIHLAVEKTDKTSNIFWRGTCLLGSLLNLWDPSESQALWEKAWSGKDVIVVEIQPSTTEAAVSEAAQPAMAHAAQPKPAVSWNPLLKERWEQRPAEVNALLPPALSLDALQEHSWKTEFYESVHRATLRVGKDAKGTGLYERKEFDSKKDRYTDIYPYAYNTVSLRDETYVNASAVESHGQHYIATQGPLNPSNHSPEGTISDFWNMVFEQESDLIVALAMEFEKGHQKCANYWELTEPLDIGNGRTVQKTGEKVLLEEGEQAIVERTFTITEGETSREIRQLHYQNWPDFGNPDAAVFGCLL